MRQHVATCVQKSLQADSNLWIMSLWNTARRCQKFSLFFCQSNISALRALSVFLSVGPTASINSPLVHWICLKKRFTFHSFIISKLFPKVFLVALVIPLSSGNLPELIWTWCLLSEGCLQNVGNPRERKCYFPGKKSQLQFWQTL